MCDVCSNLTIVTLEQRWPSVFIVNFEQISLIVLVFHLLLLNKQITTGPVSRIPMVEIIKILIMKIFS